MDGAYIACLIFNLLGLSEEILIYPNPSNDYININYDEEIWKLEINEVSELLEIDENEFILLNVDSKINENQLTYSDAEQLVIEKLNEKLKVKNTILKSENDFKITKSEDLKKLLGLKCKYLLIKSLS